MWKEKLKLFATNLRILIYIVLAAAIAFGAVFVWNKYNLQQVVVDMSDATIAVLGTLLGAIVGGLFTLIGTNYLHRKTLKAQTEIKKKNLIYKPLYDELKDIQQNKLSSNEYPRYVQLDKNGHDYPNMIRFSVWGRIKNDTRFLESPKILIQEMEKLYAAINDYLAARERIGNILTTELNVLLESEKNTKCTIQNIGDSLAHRVLVGEKIDVFEYMHSAIAPKVEISTDEQQRINNLFYERCVVNAEIQQTKVNREAWEKQQKLVLELLITLIALVTKKYEE